VTARPRRPRPATRKAKRDRPAAARSRAGAAAPHGDGRGPLSTVTICIDGASRGNPGNAAIGVLVRADHSIVREIAERIGFATNNVAEYKALLRGLEEAAALGASTVHIQSDSELLVRQIQGKYQVRNEALLPLYREALARLRRFDHVHIFHVPRTRNSGADGLANRALDAKQRGTL
jgi:ribonuclease HI